MADLVITCLPIPLVLQLNMPLHNRLGILVLFCLGFVVLIASALRTYYFWVANVVSYDVTWEAYPLWIASAVEVNVGLVSTFAHFIAKEDRQYHRSAPARPPYAFSSNKDAFQHLRTSDEA